MKNGYLLQNKRFRIVVVFVSFACIMASCGSRNTGNGTKTASAAVEPDATMKNDFIKRVTTEGGDRHKPGETIVFSVQLQNNFTPDSLSLYVDNKRMGLFSENRFEWKIPANYPLGQRHYRVVAYRGEESSSNAGTITLLSSSSPKHYTYRVVKSYPHSTSSYTQGLYYEDGFLFEGTGLNGESALQKVDLATGKIVKRQSINADYFGEGIAHVDGKIFQLTWQNNRALVYDPETFRQTGEFGYDGEGWGLTTDGKNLYMSGGTEKIFVIDPSTFKRISTIQVYSDKGKVSMLNELEWIDKEIWANIYTSDVIVRIDPSTGAVTGAFDLSGLLPKRNHTSQTDVLNGIAYDRASGRIFVTGKNWDTLFEIRVVSKP